MELLIKHGGNAWLAHNRSVEAAIKLCGPRPARTAYLIRAPDARGAGLAWRREETLSETRALRRLVCLMTAGPRSTTGS